MLLWSQQWKIVNDISLSFQKNNKIYTKISEKSLQRDKIFLNPDKYSNTTKNDFKFITLWSCLQKDTNKIGILKLLQSYTKEDLKYINKQKNRMIYYNNTLKNDINTMKPLILNEKIIQKLYNQDVISFIGAWWYLQDSKIEGRLLTNFVNKLNNFMNYFDKVKDEISNISKKELYA